jgi:uncharacterized protein YdcH (DUF465 family)
MEKTPPVGPSSTPRDPEQLRSRHQALEKRLADLERQISWTPAEQVERIRLKKEKLWIRDQLQALAANDGAGARKLAAGGG